MSELSSTPHPPPTAREMRDDRAIRLLAEGNSPASVAALCGVSVTTIYRKAREPLFASKVADARAERLKPLADSAFDAAPPALAKLIAIGHDEKVHSSSRIRALALVIELSLRLEDAVSVLPRLAAVEVALQRAIGMCRSAISYPQGATAKQEAEDVFFGSLDHTGDPRPVRRLKREPAGAPTADEIEARARRIFIERAAAWRAETGAPHGFDTSRPFEDLQLECLEAARAEIAAKNTAPNPGEVVLDGIDHEETDR